VTVNEPAPTKPPPRFLLLDGVAVELSTSKAQVYAMVRSGELPAIKVGGRGQWRVERTKLEGYIAKAYTDTATWVHDNPYGNDVDPDDVDRDERPEEPRAPTEP
jgi:excisionase family DNA binding protein